MSKTLLAGLFGLLLLAPSLSWADTCTTTNGLPTYSANVAVPVTCDLHGRLQMIPVNEDGTPVTFVMERSGQIPATAEADTPGQRPVGDDRHIDTAPASFVLVLGHARTGAQEDRP